MCWFGRLPCNARCDEKVIGRLHRAQHTRSARIVLRWPQIGAVLVPINYRLTADDFAYLIQHSGARIVCAPLGIPGCSR